MRTRGAMQGKGRAQRGIRVCMLVRNPCTHDARVLREAKALAASGYKVTIIAVNPGGDLPEQEERDGFQIIRVEVNPLSVRAYRAVRKAFRAMRTAPALVGRLIARLLGGSAEAEGRPLEEQSPLWRLVKRLSQAAMAIVRGLAVPFVLVEHLLLTRLARNAVMLFHEPLSLLDYGARCGKIIAQQPAHIYHAHDFNTLPVGYFLSRRYKGKLVYDSHELNLEAGRMARVKGLQKWLLRAQERFFIRRCDAVITVNRSIADLLAKQYAIMPPVVVMNCPEPVDLLRGDALLHRKLGLAPQATLVLYQGGLAEGRGLTELVQAFRQVPQAVLVFLGSGVMQETLQRVSRELGLEQRVQFLEPVPQEVLLTHTASAAVGVVSYKATSLNNYYATPNKIFEYLMAGVPVVASNFPEMARIVLGDDVGAVFDPDDPDSIAAAINSILGRADYPEMRQRARQVARGRYTWSIESQNFLAVYHNLFQKV